MWLKRGFSGWLANGILPWTSGDLRVVPPLGVGAWVEYHTLASRGHRPLLQGRVESAARNNNNPRNRNDNNGLRMVVVHDSLRLDQGTFPAS